MQERYDLIVLYSYNQNDSLITSIVIKPFQSSEEGATLYVKGTINAMYEFLKEDNQNMYEFIDNDGKQFAQSGLHSTLLAKKELTP